MELKTLMLLMLMSITIYLFIWLWGLSTIKGDIQEAVLKGLKEDFQEDLNEDSVTIIAIINTNINKL